VGRSYTSPVPTDIAPEREGDGGHSSPAASNRIRIRQYQPDDLEGALRLRPLAYPGWKEAALAEWHIAVYDWLARNPAAGEMLRWVIEDDGEIVGHLAAVPLWYRIGDRRILAHTPTDYMALPGHGFHAVGLMRTFFRTCPDYVACNVVGDASRIEGFFKTAPVTNLTQFVKIVDLGRYPRLPSRVPHWLARLAGRAIAVIDRVVLVATSGRSAGLRVEEADEFDASFDAFFDQAAAAVPCIPEKGSAFLRWRYGPGTPRGPMRLLVVREGAALLGYAVLRTTESGEGFILDLMVLPGRRDVGRALLRAIVRRFWRDRAWVARYRFVPSAVSPAPADIRRLGFLARGAGRSAIPGTRPERQLQLLVRFADPEAQAVAVEAEHWAYNLGDGEASFWVH
jgi:hypothetical protein